MKLLITGICGFVGKTLATSLLKEQEGLEVIGVDNLIRPGSELNRPKLAELGVKFYHADIRSGSDLDVLPPVDYVIDAAANSSVLAGLGQQGASRQLLEHNLGGTTNLLEYCRKHRAGFILLSTSRVFSIPPLAALEIEVVAKAFRPRAQQSWPSGCSLEGIAENFSTQAPISLYGSTKLASEILAFEYGSAFGFPVWCNRCGVLAGAEQFGRADQGIFSFWIHAYASKTALKYTGFNGTGHQVRDALHPEDLVPVLRRQMATGSPTLEAPLNFGGGSANSMSLAQLTDWCDARFGPHPVAAEPAPRPFDIPWLVMDSRAAARRWGWKPKRNLESILEELAHHAEQNPDWLQRTAT